MWQNIIILLPHKFQRLSTSPSHEFQRPSTSTSIVKSNIFNSLSNYDKENLAKSTNKIYHHDISQMQLLSYILSEDVGLNKSQSDQNIYGHAYLTSSIFNEQQLIIKSDDHADSIQKGIYNLQIMINMKCDKLINKILDQLNRNISLCFCIFSLHKM